MRQPALASSILEVPPSRIRELANIALEMDGVLRLYFGESNRPTPDLIKKAAVKALEEGFTYYTHNAGLLSLRRAIADKYSQLHQVVLDPMSEVVATTSGVQALNVAIRCVLDPGDEALVLTPAWPNASSIVKMCSARALEVPLQLRPQRYEIDFDALDAARTARTRLLVYTSPSNPLGWVATIEDQKRLLDFCKQHGLWLLADEVYERLFFSGTVAPSILRVTGRDDAVIVAQSFSKTYCMTGWRLGWLIARRDLARKATEMNEFIISHAPSMIQRAAETALRDGELEIKKMVEELHQNLEFCCKSLADIPGIALPVPEGAFYLFPKIEGMKDSFDFCKRLLIQKNVGLAPGVAFGKGGEGSVRICYAADRNILIPAIERFREFLKTAR